MKDDRHVFCFCSKVKVIKVLDILLKIIKLAFKSFEARPKRIEFQTAFYQTSKQTKGRKNVQNVQ